MKAHNGMRPQDIVLLSDFEDIVHVLNNRQSIWEEMKNAHQPVKQYLKSEFAKL